MKKLNIIIILVLLSSCTDRTTDRTKFEDVGKATLKAVIDNDTIKLKELFKHNMDSLNVAYKVKLFAEIAKYRGKSYTYINTDTSFFSFFDVKWQVIGTYFKIDTNYYSIKSFFSLDDKGKISINEMYINNLSENCNNSITQPYRAQFGIDFNSFMWTTDYRKKTFTSGQIKLANNLETDIEFLKFRLILKNNDETFFNQTVIYKGNIYAGDIKIIEISEIVDYFTGFTIEKNNLKFEAKVIEVLPKPESYDCKKIKELKAFQ